jgi:hypothetical protein
MVNGCLLARNSEECLAKLKYKNTALSWTQIYADNSNAVKRRDDKK